MPEEIQQQIASDRPAINRAAVKAHGLLCSKTYRSGKFTRVGESFETEVEAGIEAMIREIRGKFSTLHAPLGQGGYDVDTPAFVKGPLLEKIGLELDKAIARLIQNKVQKQPSCGCTLKNTY